VIPPAIFFYYSTLFDSRFKTLQQNRIAHKLGYEYSVVLGHSKYYPKAGYIPASECGIKAPFEVDDESFMALNLNGSQNKLNGVIEYDKAFGI
ncbi:hypothetical protein ACQUFK_15000, partial [Enterococcus faecalis]